MPIAALVPLLPFAVSLPAPGLDGTPTIAAAELADGWDAEVGAGGIGGTDERAGTIGVAAEAATTGDHDDVDGDFHVRGVAATGGTVGVRAGGPSWLGASHWAHASYDFLPTADGNGAGLFAMALEHHLDVGAVPSLFASRDTARAGFAREQVGLDITGLSAFWGGRRLDVCDEGIAAAWTWQPDGALGVEVGMHGVVARYAHDRFGAEILGVSAQAGGQLDGPAGGGVVDVTPVRLTGIGVGGDVTIDLGGGFEGGGGARPGPDGAVIDLPDVVIGAYDLGVHAGGLDARAHRRMYLALDGELSVEDRLDAQVATARGATQVALRGFAARTTWWTDAQDPGTTAVTGGGEVTIAREDRGFDWDASLGVARSFYATADGSAAPPALGARGTVEVRRSLRRRR